jgi:RhtB (resistance to homoserine/threonine) family protein
VITDPLAFLAVSALVICTPGPDTALTIRNAVTGGRRSGIATAAGVSVGQLVWTVAASLGLASLLQASQPAFEALQLLGAAYLIFLGVQSLRSALRRSPSPGGTELDLRTPSRSGPALRQGLLNNLANPKMAAFFVSLLPQFVVPGTSSTMGFLLLGAIFCGMTFGWLSLYAVVLHRLRNLFLRSRVRRVIDGLSGVVLIGFGVRVATAER